MVPVSSSTVPRRAGVVRPAKHVQITRIATNVYNNGPDADSKISNNLLKNVGPLRVFAPLREASAALANSVKESLDVSENKTSIKLIQAPVSKDMDICRKNLVDVVGKRHPLLFTA